MSDAFKMGLRSIIYRKKQYVSIFLVCLFGIGISIFSIFLINGMLSALKNKARIYYGGDYQFMGGTYDYELFDYDEYINDLKTIFPKKIGVDRNKIYYVALILFLLLFVIFMFSKKN